MVSSTRTVSRTHDVRATSAARTLVRQRDKPYKTEQSRIREKRKKLTLRTTFQEAPPGFQFLPVGTPDLAERCKELSRIRGLPVNIVNGDPKNKNGKDESKVSHHILRVGYHFRSEVVDDACSDLGYIYVRGKFVKEIDYARQSILAQTMLNHGLRPAPGAGLEPQHETGEQIRAAVKELFPRIPHEDLEYILEHAWAEGSKRVGTQTMLPLSRRVQLATIARIRHHYTDYDRLLRAFEWSEARLMVEPTCVQKLLEWRGENEDHDDEIEEIVREVIVIDDDEDDDAAMMTDGAQQSIVLSSEDSDSDASVKITYRPALQEDLGVERYDERSMRFVDNRPTEGQRRVQRDADVRQRIGQARLQMRNLQNNGSPANPPIVHVPHNQLGNDTVVLNGRTFRKAPAQLTPQSLPPPVSYRLVPVPHQRNILGFGSAPQDQPIPSVEPRETDHVECARRDVSNPYQTHQVSDEDANHRTRDEPSRFPDVRYVNLTTRTPPLAHRYVNVSMADHNSPSQIVRRDYVDLTSEHPTYFTPSGHTQARHEPAEHDAMFPGPPKQYIPLSSVGTSTQQLVAEHPGHRGNTSGFYRPNPSGLVDAQVAPIQYMPLQPRHRHEVNHQRYAKNPSQFQPVYSRAIPGQEIQRGVSSNHQLLHGAPAPIQQMARSNVSLHSRPSQAYPPHTDQESRERSDRYGR